MRDAFTRALQRLAAEDKNLLLVTGDLGFGVLKPFWETYPDQFINAGIAEQAMTSLAAGLVSRTDFDTTAKKLYDGDYLVMMTDGVLEALPGMEKEEQMKAFCLEHRAARPKELAADVLAYAQSFGAAKDDMTVLVAGIWKK